jgi:hypothetical protein
MEQLENIVVRSVKPIPDVIQKQLGAESCAYQEGRATLVALFATNREIRAVKTKRLLWSKLLSTALGTQFDDNDDLFVAHTLLANSAAIIAHAAIGFDVEHLAARALLSGEQFDNAQLHGVVERDCFDWVCEVAGGDAFIRSLAVRLSRFDWSDVEHDVLKVLYESVITAETRKKLGEYYTPDWLAYKVVEHVVANPLEQRVLDPSCGSGTFLFHSIRRYLDAAKAKKWRTKETLDRLTRNVIGMDLHPVAVTFARVTYLLAIGRNRLVSKSRGAIRIPVFLGDSMLWPKQEKKTDETWDLIPPEFRFPMELQNNQVDILIGNPPWLAYRHMPGDMQAAFRVMSIARGMWHGAKVATHQDLSAIFVARATELYLKKNGRFGFVMPSAVIDTERQHYKGFRTGELSHSGQVLYVAFEQPWDLKRLRPHFFPITASVVFGSRQNAPVVMPHGETWSGQLPKPHGSWSDVESAISRATQIKTELSGELSPYAERFRQGATIVPRVLFMVERRAAGPLGRAQGKTNVRSLRSANEKAPWKNLPDREGIVESIFVKPVYLGESVLPYRTRTPLDAVIPRDRKGIMDGASKRLDQYPLLAKWWRSGEKTWLAHRSSERLSLTEQLNYHNKLDSQCPAPAIRVLYGTSGMHIAAARIDDERAIIDSSLYWAAAESEDEALYLCAILNAPVTTRVVRPLMSFGKDERHIHKFVWKLAIPYFQPADMGHQRLVKLARELEVFTANVDLPDDLHFAAARRRLRETIDANSAGREIEEIVGKMLGS